MKKILYLFLATLFACSKTTPAAQLTATTTVSDPYLKANYISNLTLAQSSTPGWIIASWTVTGVEPDTYAYQIDNRDYEPGVFHSGVSIGQLIPGMHIIHVKASYAFHGGGAALVDSMVVR